MLHRTSTKYGVKAAVLVITVLSANILQPSHATETVIVPANNCRDFRKIAQAGLHLDQGRLRKSFVPPVDGSNRLTLDCAIENDNAVDVELIVSVSSGKARSEYFLTIPPHLKNIVQLPLFHLRYSSCNQWPAQHGVRIRAKESKLNTGAISSVEFNQPQGAPPICLARVQFGTIAKSQQWIDEFGQNANVNWPGKVTNVMQLKQADALEEKTLRKSLLDPRPDKYRSWISGPQLKSTGFFRLEKVRDRWWLVAPSGKLFYSTGINCVTSSAWTKLRPPACAAYRKLPPKTTQFASAYKNDALSMYTANLIRKWNANFLEKCSERSISRMKYWGFTTLGNWSDEKIIAQSKMPFVSVGPETWRLKIQYLDGDIPDVYDAEFLSEAEHAAQPLSKHSQEDMLVGYFLDNELPWWNIPYDVFALKDEAPAKVAWIERLKSKYQTIETLNQAWHTNYKDFFSIRLTGTETAANATADLKELVSDFAERFYATWFKAIKKADPNHLVLGSRIPYAMDEVVLPCARHTDVLSFNHYSTEPVQDFARYYKLTGKPILIGEYGFDSLDAGLLTAFVPVKDQGQRAVGFTYYTEQAAALPFIVGTHYFQYLDEPITGREDGETSFNGFISVTDIPYPAMVEAARRTNQRIYGIHSGKIRPAILEPLQ